MSMGLFRLAAGGKTLASSAFMASEGDGVSKPSAASASTAKIPGPPALVTMATLGPLGNF